MKDDSFSTKLRNLSKDYYQNHISLSEYRTVRKKILDQIDEEFNGRKVEQHQLADPLQASMLMKTIAFFANKDLLEKEKPG